MVERRPRDRPRDDAEPFGRTRDRQLVPALRIRAGGIHGDGFSSAESNGFDSGETRSLNAKQSPKGVRKFTRLAWCRPHFQMIESG
jgi:hypothetical protein